MPRAVESQKHCQQVAWLWRDHRKWPSDWGRGACSTISLWSSEVRIVNYPNMWEKHQEELSLYRAPLKTFRATSPRVWGCNLGRLETGQVLVLRNTLVWHSQDALWLWRKQQKQHLSSLLQNKNLLTSLFTTPLEMENSRTGMVTAYIYILPYKLIKEAMWRFTLAFTDIFKVNT